MRHDGCCGKRFDHRSSQHGFVRPMPIENIAIKSGTMEYEALLQKADELIETIEQLHKNSTLPETPNVEKATQILISMRATLYQ